MVGGALMLGAAASMLLTAGSLGAAMWLCLVAAVSLVHEIRGLPEASREAGEAVVVGGDRVDHVGEEPDLGRELARQEQRRQDLPAEAEPSQGHAAPIGHRDLVVAYKTREIRDIAKTDVRPLVPRLNKGSGSAPGGRT